MSHQKQEMQLGTSPAKLALVGVLSAVLAYVLINNSEDEALQPLTKSDVVSLRRTPLKKQQTQRSKSDDLERKELVAWPQVDLQEVAAHDPFSKPMWYLAADSRSQSEDLAESIRSKALEKLTEENAVIVMVSGNERVARIGDRDLRVGDTIEGLQVEEITAKGIVLTEIGQ